jgi:hypothetical protein
LSPSPSFPVDARCCFRRRRRHRRKPSPSPNFFLEICGMILSPIIDVVRRCRRHRLFTIKNNWERCNNQF